MFPLKVIALSFVLHRLPLRYHSKPETSESAAEEAKEIGCGQMSRDERPYFSLGNMTQGALRGVPI